VEDFGEQRSGDVALNERALSALRVDPLGRGKTNTVLSAMEGQHKASPAKPGTLAAPQAERGPWPGRDGLANRDGIRTD
jgi:hypothetical protein